MKRINAKSHDVTLQMSAYLIHKGIFYQLLLSWNAKAKSFQADSSFKTQ